MKYLILGSHGQLGSAFCQELQLKNDYFASYDRISCDIVDNEVLNEIIIKEKPDIVFNCSSYNNVDQAEMEFNKAILINAIAVKNLALLSEKYNFVLVHFSTHFVFDGKKKEPYSTSDIPNPLNKYALSKYQGEINISSFSSRFFIIRLSWVFSTSFSPNVNFLRKIMLMSQTTSEIRIIDDQFANPTYVKDIVYYTLKLIETGQYGLYHFANNGCCSKFQWAELILRQLGWQGNLLPCKTSDFKNTAKRPYNACLDLTPLESLTDIPIRSWKEATRDCINEIRRLELF